MSWIDEEVSWRVLSVKGGTWRERLLLMMLAHEADSSGVSRATFDELLQWTKLNKSELKQTLRLLRVMHQVDFDGEPGESEVYQMKVGFWGTPRQDGISDEPLSDEESE